MRYNIASSSCFSECSATSFLEEMRRIHDTRQDIAEGDISMNSMATRPVTSEEACVCADSERCTEEKQIKVL